MIKMEESAKFAKLEHLSSYSAAEVLGSDDLERVTYYPKKGWFVTRWQATILVIAITLFICTIVYMVRPAYQNDQWLNEHNSNTREYQYHQNVTTAMHELPYLGLLEENRSQYVRFLRPSDEDLLKYLVEPIHYKVKITNLPNFQAILAKEFDFEGEVVIDLHSRENIDYLLIGASELQIETPTVQIKIPSELEARANDIQVDAMHQQEGLIRINFKEPLKPSTVYEMKISYRGRIRSLPYGLFYMIDRNPDTLQENFLIATNSDTPYARTIFPCFDAREQSATFEISISQDQQKHFESSILTNWESENTGDGQIWQRCNVTQPMRTDNFQFIITSYHEQSVMTPELQHFSVWTTKEQKSSVAYVLDIGIKLIEDLQVYFDVPLPASKVDIFALPHQIPYLKSKMGMIYTPESNVLYSEKKNSEQHKRKMALAIAAHIAEQWIESIITFSYDEDEWLKESLVEYLKYKILNFVEPEWKLEAAFYSDVQQIEMQNDISQYIAQYNQKTKYHAPRYSFPLRDRDPATAASILKGDNLEIGFLETAAAGIYNRLHRPKLGSKGACILRMLQHMVTEPIFRISLTLFLEKGNNEDVFIHDFWSIMSSEVEKAHQIEYQLLPEGVSLNSVVKTWIENDGYPILNVYRDYDNGTITFSQLHFLARQGRRDNADELVHWYIPISFTTQKESYFSATAPRVWLGKSDEKTIENPSNLNREQWLLINPQQTAFYRVNYDQNNWNMLKKSLHSKEFPPMIRAQLFEDALYFGRKGMLDYSFALNLTLYLGDFTETDYTVWKSVLRHLNYIQNLLIHADDNSGGKYESKIYELFKIYVKWLIESAFHSSAILTQENMLLRPDIFLWACATDVSLCKTRAEKDFNLWKESEDPDENNPIDPDLRYAVLCSVMRNGRKEDFEFLIDRYTNALAVNPDKYEYLKSLFCYPKEEEINRILNMTLSPGYSEILLGQIQQIWSAAGETFFPTEVPFQYLIKNWEEIENKYSEFHIIITAIVKNGTNNIYTILSRDTLKKFEDEQANQLTYLEIIFKTAMKAIDDKITWKTSRIDDLASWLKSNLSYFKERRFADYD